MTSLAPMLALPRIHKTVEVWNALLSHCGASLPLGPKGVAAIIDRCAAPDGPCTAALVTSGSLGCVALFDIFPFRELFDANIEAADLDVLPRELRDVLVEGIVSTLWSLVPQNELPSYSIGEIGDWRVCAENAPQPLDWFSVSVTGLAPRPVCLRIGCVAEDAARRLAAGNVAARAAWSVVASDFLYDAYFSFAAFKTSLAQLRRLASGDLIVLDPGADSRVCVCVERRKYEFATSDEGWLCVSVAQRHAKPQLRQDREEQPPMDSTDPDQDADSPQPELEELLVDLDFDLGERKVSIPELETWKPGSIVDLDVPDTSGDVVVTIRANGLKFATGDLVRIDERLAVRISRLLVRT